MKQYKEYKDSGIQWLGEIPTHWEIAKLKHKASCNDDVLSENTDADSIIRYVEISDVDSSEGIKCSSLLTFGEAPSRARRITRVGDVIVSTVRTYLKAIASINEDGLIVSTGFAVIRPQKINSSFLKYSLLNDGFIGEVISRSVGVSYPAITSTELMGIDIIVPPLAEQEIIAAYLDQKVSIIDAIIAEKDAMVEQLTQYRKSLISETVTRGLDPNVPMKDSGIEWLGQIPEHWECAMLKYYLSETLQYGANESAESENRSWPRYIRITDISETGKLKDETFKSLAPEKAKDYMLQKGDILFARSGATVGKTYIFDENYPACFAGYLIKARCGNKLLPQYLYLYTCTNEYDNWKNSVFIQATIQNIGADKYSTMPIVVPSFEEQISIVKHLEVKVNNIEIAISELQSQVEDLKNYKTSVISEAVTGKVDLRDWKMEEITA